MGLGWRTLGRCVRIFNELEPKILRRTKTGHFLLFPYIQNQDCISAVRRWGVASAMCAKEVDPMFMEVFFSSGLHLCLKGSSFIFSSLLK